MTSATPGKFERLDQLLRAANEGDDAAYSAFLFDTAKILRGFAARRIPAHSNGFDPEDLVQEILMAVHTKRHTWRSGEPVAPWIFAIARYKAIDAYRRQGKRINLDISDFSETLDDPGSVPTGNANDIATALKSLAGRQRDVVSALSVEGRSVAETAERLGVSEGAVRVAFHRGLSAISARFGQK